MLASAEGDARCPPRVRAVLKASVNAGSLADPTWAGGLSEYRTIIGAYVESLASVSFFDRALADNAFVRVPPGGVIAITVTSAIASIVGEGQVTPVSSMTLAGPKLVERKALAEVIVTNETARDPRSTGYIGGLLTGKVVEATNTSAIGTIIAAGTSSATAGGSVANLISDIQAAFAAIQIGAQSRLYWTLNADLAKSLSGRLAGSVGWTMTPFGGTLAGVPVVVSDGAPAGNLILVDASRFAAFTDVIVPDVTTQASVPMSSTPDSPPTGATVLVSLWQEDKTGLKVTRYFGIQALAGTTASHVTTGMS